MLLSFCIATYNRSSVIMELVETLLSIESEEFEVVVVDDCSTDDTQACLAGIEDKRLRVVQNRKNQGSIMNIYRAIDAGQGEYLFYLNDRDGVKKYKILPLIKILKELKNQDVAFARCDSELSLGAQYQVFESGEAAIVEFACRITHPTGYIFKKTTWKEMAKKKVFFSDEKYGDYPTANLCAVLAKRYNGARILGDICNANYERIDFKQVKSGYYKNRKDKRLWYTPEVSVRELNIAVKLMRSLNIETPIIMRTILFRFAEYMRRDVNLWYVIASQPSNSYHYGVAPPKKNFWKPIRNGLYIYKETDKILKKYYPAKLYRNELREITKNTMDAYRKQ